MSDTAIVTIQLNALTEGVTPPDPGPGPGPDPDPDPDPGPDPDPDDEVDLGGPGGGGGPAPEPAPEPVVEVVVEPQPEPVVVKAEPEPRVKIEKPKPELVAKTIDVNRESDGTTPFRQAMDIMSEGVGTTGILDEVQHNTVQAAFKDSSFALSAGFLTWALRGASLLASVAASLPAWQGFDPLPVLAAKKGKAKDEDVDGGDDKSDADWQEKRIQRLLNPMGTTGDE